MRALLSLKIVQPISLIILFFVAPIAVAQNKAALELTQLIHNTKTYQADFKQTTYGQNGSIVQTSKGEVFMMRPGKFRWETSKPFNQIIIANGKTLWNYDADLKQATRQRINQRGSVNPASLLTGNVDHLLRDFTVTKPYRSWYQLKPKQKSSAFKMMQMQFRRGKLRAIKMVNNLGQRSYFQFSDISVNRDLKPSLFIFVPPPGVSVIKQ